MKEKRFPSEAKPRQNTEYDPPILGKAVLSHPYFEAASRPSPSLGTEFI